MAKVVTGDHFADPYGVTLKCPICAEEYLHCGGVLVNRQADIRKDYDDLDASIEITFWCEHCPDKDLTLRITNHEGQTFLRWLVD